jgi:hypothetical protein
LVYLEISISAKTKQTGHFLLEKELSRVTAFQFNCLFVLYNNNIPYRGVATFRGFNNIAFPHGLTAGLAFATGTILERHSLSTK